MTNESWIPAPSRPTPMATSNWSLKGTQRKLLCKTNFNKISFIFYLVWFSMDYPSSPNWTLDFCVFSAVFLPLEPTILFLDSSAVSYLKSRDFRLYEPTIHFWPLVSGFPHRKFLWSRDRSRPIRSLHMGHTGPLYYSCSTSIFF